jgi:hypothetical protein
MTDRIARIAFVLACIALAVTYGIFSVRWNSFPNPQIAQAEVTIRDFVANWRNDYGLDPVRHLVKARRPHQGGDNFRMHQAGAAQPGTTLTAALSPDQQESVHAATLYDAAGREIYRWPLDYAALDPDGPKPRNVMVHGVYPLPDGSLIAAFDQGEVIGRIDACGRPMWVHEGRFHHAIEPDDDGGLWSWRDEPEAIVRFDAATGEVTREIYLKDIVAADGGHYGELAIHAAEDARELRYLGDAFHPNDVEPLRASLAGAFPMFETGDLLISLRELNLVAVIDSDDASLKWFRHGPWHRQHDPDWEPDGTISVYDNRMALGASRILKVDPATDAVTVAYEGSAEHPFYSYRRGKHQVLPNGNVLVTEAEAGRVFEAAPDGTLVWERDFGWDAERNLIVTSAERLPADFFQAGALACGASVRR